MRDVQKIMDTQIRERLSLAEGAGVRKALWNRVVYVLY